MICVVAGVTDAALDDAERELGVSLPSDYRDFLRGQDGYAASYGGAYVEIYSLAAMLAANRDLADLQRAACPGLVVFGSDGSREVLGWDYRTDPPPVVLVSITTESWADALPQAPDFGTLLTQLRATGSYRWS
jgi:hypothetical protein